MADRTGNISAMGMNKNRKMLVAGVSFNLSWKRREDVVIHPRLSGWNVAVVQER
jgi:hypothetical protein